MEEKSKFANWKSFVAFFLFIGIYAYTVYQDKDAAVLETTGYIALYAMAFMMVRNEKFASVIDTVNSVVKDRFGQK